MFVADWMTKKVVTITPDDNISAAVKLMKEYGIKHLPVLKEGKLKGLLSDRDIKDFTPSCATSLDIYELHYLLAVAKVKAAMQGKVVTTSPETPIEEAAMIMYDRNIGCLPVLGPDGLCGIISDRDLFRALVDITGVRHGGPRITLTLADQPGSIKEVADIVRKHGFRLQSILTSYERAREGSRLVVIRIKGSGNFKMLKAELQGTYKDVRISVKNAISGLATRLSVGKRS